MALSSSSRSLLRKLSLRSSLSLLSSSRYYQVEPFIVSKASTPSSATSSSSSYRFFSSIPPNLDDIQVAAPIDPCSLLAEDEYHKLADSTIHDLQEKFEEYGDQVQVDGFDIDYGNQVLTLKLGDLGTYVLNKQTPNRQLWLSSPVSGPSRFDWDKSSQAWVYRRTKANLLRLLESEFQQLCGEPISLS